jgi:hypothetical protein
MIGRTVAALALAAVGLLVPVSAYSQPSMAPLGMDCKEAPTPDMPGQGLSSFFSNTPDPLPPQEDPFARGATTTIYEQYGYAGLRWNNYDLGCGPDAARHPDAVVGTAFGNWMLNVPLALTAITSSITEVAFAPTFLDVFDPTIQRVSDALYRGLFASWVPAVLALLGIAVLLKARRAALATTAASIGWAMMVILVATAVFKWPIAAGHFADDTVTATLGTVVGDLNEGQKSDNPGVTVASHVHESIFYSSWLAGTLGSTDSETVRRYGADLFKSQALTWREAQIVQNDPQQGQVIIEQKKERFAEIAAEIKANDPAAYEHLTGKRSDTRVGYALLSSLGALLALPFLLVASLLLIGSFLIVRLAVMLFPAFATIGVFPAGRGVVLGIGRTVGAALVNSVIFGLGAAVTIRVLGLILDPSSRLPAWLSLVLMPLFGFIMWVALKPFRRLTTMVSPHADPFNDAAGAVGDASTRAKRWTRRAVGTAAAAYTGGVAAAVTADALDDVDDETVPDRAEARTAPVAPLSVASSDSTTDAPVAALPAGDVPAQPTPPPPPPPPSEGPDTSGSDYRAENGAAGPALEESPPPMPTTEEAPLPPTEPEWYDGEEVYTIYRPADSPSGDPDTDDAA